MHQRTSPPPAQPTTPERSSAAPRQARVAGGAVATCFQQPCPACGRRLLIRVEHLGRRISCGHCRRRFVARDPSQDRSGGAEVGPSMLQRAEELLALLESRSGSREPRTA